MNNRLYIAGKITGDPDYKIKFHIVKANLVYAQKNCSAQRCRECPFHSRDYILGCQIHSVFPSPLEVVDPAETKVTKPYWLVMVICLVKMAFCKYVFFLKDWQESRGATIEHKWALRLNKIIINQK